ncbi:hypothetical protein ACWEKM_26010 [Streptomyces sp. NPDC004752]
MLRHEFQPGRLVAGVFLTATATAYAGDAGGLWETPWFTAIPLIVGGLSLAGAAAVLARTVRARRSSAHPKKPHTDTPT